MLIIKVIWLLYIFYFKSKLKSLTKGPCLSLKMALLVEFPIEVLAKPSSGF